MKVSFIINSLRADGGAENALLGLVRELTELNIVCGVITLREKGGLFSKMEESAADCICLNRGKRAYTDIGGWIQAGKILRDWNTEVVHTHLPEAGIVGRIAAELVGVPAIVATEHNQYYSRKYMHVVLERALAGVTDRHIAVSHSVAAFYSGQTGMKLADISVVPDPIVIESEHAVSEKEVSEIYEGLGFDRNDRIVLHIGRHCEQKGVPFLIKAFPEILREIPEARAVLIGSGPQRDEYESMVRRMGLCRRIRFVGRQGDIVRWLRIAEVFVFPSLWEGLGMAALEAAKVGVIVVASEVGGIAEMFESDVSAVLVQPGSVGSLAEGIKKVLMNRQWAKEVAGRGSAMVEDRCNPRTIAQKHVEIYKSCLKAIGNGSD